MEYYTKAIKNYAQFTGRARRKEYWMFFLFNLLFAFAAMILDNVLGMAWPQTGYGPIYVLYALFALVPGLALSVRRLHDVGKPGLFMFIVLIPLVGAIWLIVLFCTDGQPGTNEYGTNPKEVPSV